MRFLVVLMAVLFMTSSVVAQDLGNQAPPKTPQTYPENVRNPSLQGGDTIFSARVIPGLPYYDTGTTVGYTDDYAGSCYFAGGAPDVVYRYTAAAGVTGINISLCASSFDTGLYVYDAGLNEIACNDDFCGLQSQLDNVPLVAGQTYYIVVDGYSSASGSYSLNFGVCCGPILECPPGGVAEGEPPLGDGYVDNFNGGCNTPGYPFQTLAGDDAGDYVLCGVSGWYANPDGNFRDTDWYLLTVGLTGAIEVTVEAEYATYFFELGPRDCANVGIVQQILAEPGNQVTMTISGYAPGDVAWFWAGPTVFSPPGGEDMYDYVVWFTGLVPVAAAPTTWSTVKALYQ
jgi:hypothetical protein